MTQRPWDLGLFHPRTPTTWAARMNDLFACKKAAKYEGLLKSNTFDRD